MFQLTKWDPFRELSALRRDMDRLFKRVFGPEEMPTITREVSWYPSIDCCYAKDGNFVVKAEISGVDPKNVDISIVGNQLIIKGERKMAEELKEGDYLFKELSYGRFERSITLPEGVDTEKVHAKYNNGFLEITLPASAALAPKKIPIEYVETREKFVKAA